MEGEETLLAGLGLKNLCRFSEYEPGLNKSDCEMSKLLSLPCLPLAKVHSMDISPNVGAFGFC